MANGKVAKPKHEYSHLGPLALGPTPIEGQETNDRISRKPQDIGDDMRHGDWYRESTKAKQTRQSHYREKYKSKPE